MRFTKYLVLFGSLALFTVVISCINDNQQAQLSAIKVNNSAKDTILIVTMDFNETNLLDQIKNKVRAFYKTPVVIKSTTMPKSAYYKARNRYRADSILNFLERYNNGQYRFVAGLTSKDISATVGKYSDWGIFGLGSLNNKGCITSSFRLKKNVTEAKLLERLEKVILHEIGHNNGLNHCTSPLPCLMKAADGKVSTVDNEPMDICKFCRSKIKLN
jgi:archaemetzincin